MTVSELMAGLSGLGASPEMILMAVRALDERDAEARAQIAALLAQRTRAAERKRASRAARAAAAVPGQAPDVSRDRPATKPGHVTGQSRDIPPNEIYSNPPLSTIFLVKLLKTIYYMLI
jgi:hypothetical protein